MKTAFPFVCISVCKNRFANNKYINLFSALTFTSIEVGTAILLHTFLLISYQQRIRHILSVKYSIKRSPNLHTSIYVLTCELSKRIELFFVSFRGSDMSLKNRMWNIHCKIPQNGELVTVL